MHGLTGTIDEAHIVCDIPLQKLQIRRVTSGVQTIQRSLVERNGQMRQRNLVKGASYVVQSLGRVVAELEVLEKERESQQDRVVPANLTPIHDGVQVTNSCSVRQMRIK